MSLRFLCKSIEPLPEKYHGLTDVELKYRHRHLDLIMNPNSRKVFETRSHIIREVRNYLDGKRVLEVETPVLQPILWRRQCLSIFDSSSGSRYETFYEDQS